jgi:6,7-dimethyl-8-ribityllumazine synthase
MLFYPFFLNYNNMATSQKSLSAYSEKGLVDVSKKRFGIVVAEWNSDGTESLYSAAYESLIKHGAVRQNIIRIDVPGSYELSFGAQVLAQKKDIDAVVCLGCVIQGETRHFEFICQSVTQGIKDVSLKYNKPVIFGILTTDNKKQALDRAGGKHGNKGDEAAITAIKLLGIM